MTDPALQIPVDDELQRVLAARRLRAAVVDPDDDAAVRAWSRAEAVGFHEPEASDAAFAEVRGDFAGQRTVAVHDDPPEDAGGPVGTVTSWPAAFSLPGGEVVSWAVSGVTVASTHRRRGIAAAMIEAELRTAVAAGLPVAVLTVSEATIYRRWGFGPAAWVATIDVDARRAGWVGGARPGRVRLVDRAAALAAAPGLLEAQRRRTPGDVAASGHRVTRLVGLPSDDADLRRHRFARYDDEEGRPRGLVSYRVVEDPLDLAGHTVDVHHLAAATDAAAAALWHHLLTMDLVRSVQAQLRPADEPLRWLVADQRAIRTTAVREHLWVRVLDPVAAFGARSYSGSGRLALRVADPLGHADGSFVISASDGYARVTRAGAGPDVPQLEVPVDLLGPLLVGGVSALALARAGRLQERAPGDAMAADRLLRSPVTPHLATWF